MIIRISLLLLPFALCFAKPVKAQVSQKLAEEVIEERYPGGEKGFLKFIYLESRFPPEALENCAMGVVYSNVLVDTSGQVTSVELMNSIGSGIDEEVKRVLYLSSGQWKPSEKASQFILSIGYELVNKKENLQKGDIGGYVKLTAIGLFNCKSRAELEEKLEKKLSRKRYKRAKKYCEQLMQRYPRNQEYKNIMETIEQNL